MFGMRDAGEDVMCVSFAVNKGVQQGNMSVKKRQKGGVKPYSPKGGSEGGTPNSAKQRFAPEGESSPPTPSPWPCPVRSAESNYTCAKANLERFLCRLLALLDIGLWLGSRRSGEPLQGLSGNE